MKDSLGRSIDYLRISVTDRCNLRCVYCMPAEGVKSTPCREILRYEEILEVAKIARKLGVKHVRVTGGEPLVRKNLEFLICGLREIGFEDISLTTNGILLPAFALSLKKAGLNRTNISLDSLSPGTFQTLTRVGNLDEVMAGIRSALEADLHPVKLNMVVLAGVNDSEVETLAEWTFREPVHVRFIEVMPMGAKDEVAATKMVTAGEVLGRVQKLGKLSPSNVQGAGPASIYKLPGAKGTIGIISPMTGPFCSFCNRLRLTADGKLRPCLAKDIEYNVKEVLRRENRDDLEDRLRELIVRAITAKPGQHNLASHPEFARRMCQIGG